LDVPVTCAQLTSPKHNSRGRTDTPGVGTPVRCNDTVLVPLDVAVGTPVRCNDTVLVPLDVAVALVDVSSVVDGASVSGAGVGRGVGAGVGAAVSQTTSVMLRTP
jgi:hypothetical protein